MEHVNVFHKGIGYRGKITIAARLEIEFYDYASGVEMFAFDRIAAELYDLISDSDAPPGGVEMNLGSAVPIGVEMEANRIPTWLVINVVSMEKAFTLAEEFEKFLTLTAGKIMQRLVRQGKCTVTAEIEKDRYIIKRD